MTHHDSAPAGHVERRTLVAGAAWTIPVVATAIGAPLAAASTTGPTVAFTNGPYAVGACGTLKDVVVATTPATAGTAVTVTLPSGLAWSDGTTAPRTVSTTADGTVVLTGIRSTLGNRTVQLSAAIAGASASAPVVVAARGADGVHALNYTTRVDSLRPNSADALRVLGDTASGFLVWQDRNGDIRDGNGDPVLTGADTGAGLLAMNRQGNDALIWYKKDGVLHYFNYTTKVDQVRANSADAIRILADTATNFLVWQDANGDIRDGSGNPLITGADTGAGLLAMNRGGATGDDALIWYKKDGVLRYYNYTTKVDLVRPNSANAVRILSDTATGFLVWQDANGDIRDGSGNPVVTGADTGDGLLVMNRGGATGNDALIWYKKADGVHYVNYTTRVDTLRPNSTDTVKIVGDTATGFLVWQDANGDIRDGNGNPLVTGADTGTGLLVMNRHGNDPVIWYKKSAPCA